MTDPLVKATANKATAEQAWLAEIVWAVEHDGRTISSVADAAGISRTHVRRLLRRAAADR